MSSRESSLSPSKALQYGLMKGLRGLLGSSWSIRKLVKHRLFLVNPAEVLSSCIPVILSESSISIFTLISLEVFPV